MVLPATRLMLARARSLPAGGPVPSPCVSVCSINADSGLCHGCLRTLDEIAAWSSLDDEEKRRVWLALPARAAAQEGP